MRARLRIPFLIFFATLTLVNIGHSAEFETWSDIATIYNISSRWRYDGDQGIRGVLSGSDFTTLFFRPSVRYRVAPWFTVHGGIRFFNTFFKDDEDVFEIGPWQGLRFNWPEFEGVSISHYFRLEQRWFWESGGTRDFSLRSRYQLGARSRNYDILFKNGLFLAGSIEAFWDIESSVSDIYVNRIRYDIGLGTIINNAWRVQLHYLLHQDRQKSGDAFKATAHILRLRLFYTIN